MLLAAGSPCCVCANRLARACRATWRAGQPYAVVPVGAGGGCEWGLPMCQQFDARVLRHLVRRCWWRAAGPGEFRCRTAPRRWRPPLVARVRRARRPLPSTNPPAPRAPTPAGAAAAAGGAAGRRPAAGAAAHRAAHRADAGPGRVCGRHAAGAQVSCLSSPGGVLLGLAWRVVQAQSPAEFADATLPALRRVLSRPPLLPACRAAGLLACRAPLASLP